MQWVTSIVLELISSVHLSSYLINQCLEFSLLPMLCASSYCHPGIMSSVCLDPLVLLLPEAFHTQPHLLTHLVFKLPSKMWGLKVDVGCGVARLRMVPVKFVSFEHSSLPYTPFVPNHISVSSVTQHPLITPRATHSSPSFVIFIKTHQPTPQRCKMKLPLVLAAAAATV